MQSGLWRSDISHYIYNEVECYFVKGLQKSIGQWPMEISIETQRINKETKRRFKPKINVCTLKSIKIDLKCRVRDKDDGSKNRAYSMNSFEFVHRVICISIVCCCYTIWSSYDADFVSLLYTKTLQHASNWWRNTMNFSFAME